jgi:hypothetical protein
VELHDLSADVGLKRGEVVRQFRKRVSAHVLLQSLGRRRRDTNAVSVLLSTIRT